MEYKIYVGEHAEAEIDAIVEWIGRSSPRSAARWLLGLKKAIESLSLFPSRCSRARQQEFDTQDIRQLVYGAYRVVFVIEARTVVVLRIPHAARQTMRPVRRDDNGEEAD